MSDPSYAIQMAEETALLADAAVTALVGDAIYDPMSSQDSVYPRIDIGQHHVVPEDNTCFSPSTTYSTIHIWARGPDGRLVAKQIAAAITPVLTQLLPLDGHLMKSATRASEGAAQDLIDDDPTDADGRVAHSVRVFEYYTVPALT